MNMDTTLTPAAPAHYSSSSNGRRDAYTDRLHQERATREQAQARADAEAQLQRNLEIELANAEATLRGAREQLSASQMALTQLRSRIAVAELEGELARERALAAEARAQAIEAAQARADAVQRMADDARELDTLRAAVVQRKSDHAVLIERLQAARADNLQLSARLTAFRQALALPAETSSDR